MITTTTGAKKLEGTDNWRQIIPAHNDSVDAYDSALATQNQAIANVNSDANQTTDILTDALSVTGTKLFKASGSSYTGTLPNSNYKYGVFEVYKRNSTFFVIAISSQKEIAVNYRGDSGTWSGWNELALDSKLPDVPLLGKVLYSGTISSSATSSVSIADLSKYNVFTALIASSGTGGPAIGIRNSATSIRFFGGTIANNAVQLTFINFNTSGDSFTGFGNNTVWGTSTNGISSIRGIV